ncbi:hypothetical protein GC173_15365 [bacterium]|nr:hypothetical protein [bacterium]
MAVDQSIPGMAIRRSTQPMVHLKVFVGRPLGWVTQERSLAESNFENMIHPTAVLYEGEYWRVYSLRQADSQWVYVLEPWPSGEVMRRVVELSASALQRDAQDRKRFRSEQVMAQSSGLWSWVLGFLAARHQEQLSDHFHFDPVTASFRSGMLEFLLGMAIAAVGVIMMLGFKSMGSLIFGLAGGWMAIEGMVRWTTAQGGDQPFGLFVLEAVDYVWVLLTKRG